MARKTRSVTLIHNETAGDANHSLSDIEKLIKRAGYRVTAVSVIGRNLDRTLEKPVDLIAVAGGDGAITKIAARKRTDGIPLAILPLGTANNIAAALDIDGTVEDLIGSWETAKLRPFYRFQVEGPWGRSCVLEGIGFGCIEQVMEKIAPKKPGLRQAQEWIARSILTSPAEELDVCVGSETLSGRFALIEITIIPFVGPHLHLAPAADPSQSLIHVSFLEDRDDRRLEFSKWLLHASTDNPAPVTTRSARRVMVRGHLRRVRVNDKNWTPAAPADGQDEQPTSIYLEAEVKPIHFLVPDFVAIEK